MKLTSLLSIFVVLAAAAASAQDLTSFPQYTPHVKVSGTLVVWGNDGMVALAKRWEDGFHKYQPDIRFEDHLYSTAAAIGGLYAGHADLAYMGRDIWPVESLGFSKTFGYAPTRFVAATGAYDVEGKTFPMVVFVNKDNPLKGLTLPQLDAIFGTERKLGAPINIQKWGDLGLAGDWADKPIHLYGYASDSGFGVFFSAATMGGSSSWNCGIHQFDNIYDSTGKTITPAGRRSLIALAADKYGLAYSGIRYLTSDVRPIPIATREGAPYIAPTRENVVNRTYPLLRDIPIYINRAPGKPIDPKVSEFLSYILSREGQEAISQEGDYLPLTVDLVQQQREILK
ncbi:PstS family phosphate ABC transporter substrate-binding protein [Edaphobacter bradus]|uniref:PstS family phosphate ABC transporter substrate-binding protein n=1 Tax=Edaphobacter bradus TaxID=2259016 RepID=UPI0021DF8875|nr:substrate-binding domain-containing protein [Edaphobacter bradus]